MPKKSPHGPVLGVIYWPYQDIGSVGGHQMTTNKIQFTEKGPNATFFKCFNNATFDEVYGHGEFGVDSIGSGHSVEKAG